VVVELAGKVGVCWNLELALNGNEEESEFPAKIQIWNSSEDSQLRFRRVTWRWESGCRRSGAPPRVISNHFDVRISDGSRIDRGQLKNE
jgi:hypothetical protein